MDAIQKLEAQIGLVVAEAATATSDVRVKEAEVEVVQARRSQLDAQIARIERQQTRLEEAVTESEEALEVAQEDLDEVTQAEAKADAKLKEVRTSATYAVLYGASSAAQQEAAFGVVPPGLYDELEQARKKHATKVARAKRKVTEAQRALGAFDVFDLTRAAEDELGYIARQEALLVAAIAAGQTHVAALEKRAKHMNANLAALKAAQAGGGAAP